MSSIKKSIITAMCIALCVVFPMIFHAVQNAGTILCPMHIPVLLCGLICGWSYGAACGILGPLMSSLTAGMPSMMSLPGMMAELAVYGLIAGLMIRLIHTRKIYVDLYISLVIAMVAGRVIAGTINALIFSPAGYSIAIWASSYFMTSFPGIAAQIIFIPSILFALEKTGMIPARYPRANGLKRI